ncbi:MAG TPA: methyl-accepting chemotaxis protein [Burkholderiaceae bacterium]|nr:methyl-accepting chemotaxis protein [Burkholderiaceae bacterium]
MRVMSKMLAAPVAAVVLMLLIAGVAVLGMQGLRAALDDLARTYLAHRRTTNTVRFELASASGQLFRLFTLNAKPDARRIEAERADLKRRLGEAAAKMQKIDLPDTTDEEVLVNAAVAEIYLFAKKVDEAIEVSSVDPNNGQAAMANVDAQYKRAIEAVQVAGKFINDRADDLIARAQANAAIAAWVIWVTLALAATFALTLSIVLARRTVGELAGLTKGATDLAGGNLGTAFTSRSEDEVGEMARALEAMRQALVRTIVDIRGTSESIRTASSEVAQGNQNLSSRTEQQASSLQQTAASMEQMTSTVKNNADTANQASQLASAASEVAERGGAVVAQVVSRMGEISQSSRKIEEIIAVIDGIAFQTNILALNAAVEAARAGEQGRGFAVVASEVRSLAQRSAQAAREIKGLIADSVAKVESGSALVNEAGQTMGDIVAQVRRVTDLIGEITSATLEQSSGIGQVNQAVTQLDQMTQQNAALVEQSAAAAQSLKDQADRLAQTVAMFKVSRAEANITLKSVQARAQGVAPAAKPKAAPLKAVAATPVVAIQANDAWEEF